MTQLGRVFLHTQFSLIQVCLPIQKTLRNRDTNSDVDSDLIVEVVIFYLQAVCVRPRHAPIPAGIQVRSRHFCLSSGRSLEHQR